MRALTLMIALMATTPALAFDAEPRQPGRTGIGLGGGTLTSGLSIKHTFDEAFSLQGVAGVWTSRFGEDEILALSVDALIEMPAIHEEADFEIGWALGAGPFLGIGDDFWLGATGVAGLELNLRVIPLEFTIEYRPHFSLVGPDGVEFDPVSFGGHLRWWF